MNIKERLKQIFANVGIYVDDEEEILELDSLQFVSILVGIEDELLIQLGSDYEDLSSFFCFNDFYKAVLSYFPIESRT